MLSVAALHDSDTVESSITSPRKSAGIDGGVVSCVLGDGGGVGWGVGFGGGFGGFITGGGLVTVTCLVAELLPTALLQLKV